jgi:dihydrofolate reductase
MSGTSGVTVRLWMAMSLNAVVARADQSEDFLSRNDWDLFLELVRESDALVWGRVTHELFIKPVRELFPALPIAVVTTDPALLVDDWTVRAGSPEQAIAALAERGATKLLLAGGSRINGAFARAGLIDEVVVAVEPVIVSRGIPLLTGDVPDLRLDLVAVDDRRRPTLRLHYRVV